MMKLRVRLPIHFLAVLIASLALGGCVSRGAASRLQMDLPHAWNESAAPGLFPAPAWWTGFGSTELERLIDTVLLHSPDMTIAALRIQQAEAMVSGTGASLFPSLNLGGSGGSRRTWQTGGDAASISNSSGASLNVSYEIDLWGRIDADMRAARASLEGSRHDQEVVRLTLISGVANTYFQVLALRARLEAARNNLAIAERLLSIVETRYRSGAASALDFSRQQIAVLAQRATLRPLDIQERQTVSALAVLLGEPPQGFRITGADIQSIIMPDIAPGLPGELLTRRPDLARAESQLAAADANLDAVRAALLPSVQLSGSGGLASTSLLSLGSPARTLAFTASLSQTIFDGGRLRSQVQISDAQRGQLLEVYRKAVLAAIKEVEDALSNVARYSDQELAQTAILDEAKRSLRLAELRYREGADDLASVLDAQRTLYSTQDQIAQIRLSRLSSAVDMIKALGGGWTR